MIRVSPGYHGRFRARRFHEDDSRRLAQTELRQHVVNPLDPEIVREAVEINVARLRDRISEVDVPVSALQPVAIAMLLTLE